MKQLDSQSGSKRAPLYDAREAEARCLPRLPEVLILADDLTGAGDSALGFVKRGFTGSVRLSRAHMAPVDMTEMAQCATEICALVTYTRALDAEETRQKIETMDRLRSFEGRVLFHKVDSAGRGNPGVEMETIAEVTACDAIVYAPAFPAFGRIVCNGCLCVNDFCGQATEIDLAELIPFALRGQTRNLATGTVESLRSRLVAEGFGERRLWICDAENETDLHNIVAAASSLPLRILWSGSAGLAAAVAGSIASGRDQRQAVQDLPCREGSILVISGTDHPVTLAQMSALRGPAVALSMEEEGSIPEFDLGVVCLDWAHASAESMRAFWTRIHQAGRVPVTALVLTGGDTAAFVLEALGAGSLEIGGEVEPGIPWSIVQGGMASGVVAMTKSGGFGNKESLNRIADFCQRMKR